VTEIEVSTDGVATLELQLANTQTPGETTSAQARIGHLTLAELRGVPNIMCLHAFGEKLRACAPLIAMGARWAQNRARRGNTAKAIAFESFNAEWIGRLPFGKPEHHHNGPKPGS
jgi:hypothetical protein